MRYLVSLKYHSQVVPQPDVLAPEVNEVVIDQDSGTALYEVFLKNDVQLPFQKALHLVVDNVTNIDFYSWIGVTDAFGNGWMFFVDIDAGVTQTIRRIGEA